VGSRNHVLDSGFIPQEEAAMFGGRSTFAFTTNQLLKTMVFRKQAVNYSMTPENGCKYIGDMVSSA